MLIRSGTCRAMVPRQTPGLLQASSFTEVTRASSPVAMEQLACGCHAARCARMLLSMENASEVRPAAAVHMYVIPVVLAPASIFVLGHRRTP